MGGTFDPIHHGHLVAASEVASLFDLDEVVFVPTGEPWQKAERRVSPAEHRYLMAVIATASNPRFWVSRVDIDRPGPTYTVDTISDIAAQRPGAELFFITGADALSQILSWKDGDQALQLAHFVGVNRPGYELTAAHLPPDSARLLDVPAMAISSTTAGNGSAPASRSGTWCPTASSSTSTSTACTARTRRLRCRDLRMTATEHAIELAQTAARAAGDKLATDIVLIDVSDRLAITDVFVIATGNNERQVEAIVDEVEEKLRRTGAKPVRREGRRDGRWVLLDYADVVVHVQHAEERVFYALERLWKDCPFIPVEV
jgi:nicotinate-nucleotide adenylyltransferase